MLPLKFTHAFALPWMQFVALVLFVPSLMVPMVRVPGMVYLSAEDGDFNRIPID